MTVIKNKTCAGDVRRKLGDTVVICVEINGQTRRRTDLYTALLSDSSWAWGSSVTLTEVFPAAEAAGM